MRSGFARLFNLPALVPPSGRGKRRGAFAKLAGLHQAVAGWSKARRRPLFLAAMLLFGGGIFWSVQALDLRWSELEWTAMTGAFLLVAPALWLNGAELKLCAKATGRDMPLSDAFILSSTATVANLLPVPASVLIRGGALVSRGASLTDTGRILLNVGLLWLALAASISFFTIGIGALGTWLGLLALAAAMAAYAAIASQGGARLALWLLAIRIAILSLSIARLMLCLWALGAEASLPDAAVYTVAPVVGSAIGIVPAGLGLSEAIGAALAVMAEAPAAQAFIALGLSRFLALFAAAFAIALFRLLPRLVRSKP